MIAGARSLGLSAVSGRYTQATAFPACRIFSHSLVLLFLLPSSGNTQEVRGTVLEESTRRPVADVRVTLLGEGVDSAATATNERGVFRVKAPGAARYRVRAERLGYAVTITPWFVVAAGQEVTVTVLIAPNAIPLDPLRVEAATMVPLHREQIEERRRLGFGRFITREDIDNRAGVQVSELLNTLPGVRVADSGSGDLVVQIRARARLEPTRLPPQFEREENFVNASACPVALYVDGVKWSRDHDLKGKIDAHQVRYLMDLNQQFMQTPGAEIDIIEVYSGAASVPAIYGGTDAECGVVAVWLRRGHTPEPATAPDRVVTPLRVQLVVAASGYQVSGQQAPARSLGFETEVHWPVFRGLSAGFLLSYSRGDMDAHAMDELTAGLGYGGTREVRPLAILTGGIQSRLTLRRQAQLRPLVHARVQTAQRSVNPFAVRDADAVTSRGWSAGAGLGLEWTLRGSVAAHAVAGHDRYLFSAYENQQRADNRTAATWNTTSLRIGIAYMFGQ